MGVVTHFCWATHRLQRSTDSMIPGLHHRARIGKNHQSASWKFVNGEQSCADFCQYYICSDTFPKDSLFASPTNLLPGFLSFFTFFRSCQSATPKKHQQQKQSHPHPPPFIFFWGAPPPPKKKPTNQQKTLPTAISSQLNPPGFCCSNPFSFGSRWEKLHGERPNLRPMPWPWSCVRSCKSWRRPRVPNARRNAGRWGRVGRGELVGGFVKQGEWNPPQKKGRVAGWPVDFWVWTFCFVGKKGR